MARIRNVHPVDMVAHLWANQTQDSARNPCHNFYFHGDTIYSYGSHFPIARHVTRKGKSAVLFTTRSYSSTTAGHKCTVESACRHLTVFHVADVTGSDCRKQFAQYRAEYMGLVGKYAKARQRKPEHLDALRRLVEEANGYAAFFGLRARLTTALPVTVKLSGCVSRGMNCRLRAARGFPLRMPSRLSGFSSACTIRGKPISATGILSTSDNSPLIPLTLRGT